MAVARTRHDPGMNYWPGFVDALSTLVLGIVFLLTVFVVVQFYLTQEVTGKDTALSRLTAQIAQLTELLSMEKSGKLSLEEQLAQLRTSLAGAETERDRFKGLYDGVGLGATQAQGKVNELTGALDAEKKLTMRALAQVEVLNQQIAALRRQLAVIESALDLADKKEKDAQGQIQRLGERLNIALAQRVQELQSYRSDFFGRLRAILGNRSDVRIVGDRFVFQSELFFDTGQAVLKPEGRAELDRLATALLELINKIPAGNRLGAAGRRPYRRSRHQQPAVQEQLGAVVRPRHLGRAISHQQGRAAAAPRRRRLRRVPADRRREERRGLRPQPPHRAEADGAVSELSFTLRPYTAADEDAAIELWRRTWQQHYPQIDFNDRVAWWRERWRNELAVTATISVTVTAGRLVGFVTVDPRTLELDQIVVAPEAWGGGVAAALIAEAKRISPRGLDLHVNTDNTRAIRFYEKHGFAISGAALNWRSGAPVHKMSWRP